MSVCLNEISFRLALSFELSSYTKQTLINILWVHIFLASSITLAGMFKATGQLGFSWPTLFLDAWEVFSLVLFSVKAGWPHISSPTLLREVQPLFVLQNCSNSLSHNNNDIRFITRMSANDRLMFCMPGSYQFSKYYCIYHNMSSTVEKWFLIRKIWL